MPDIVVPGGGSRPPKPEAEAHFQKRVIALAEARGWEWMHVPRSATRGGWRTQIIGTLGIGWPDLFVVRDDECMFLELKRDGEYPTPKQRAVHAVLERVAPVRVLRPKDWPLVEELLA